jgi:hypothetical protein
VEDQNNEIIGTDFYDDSRIQNLVNAYLENPPKIQYENVPFPNLPKDKVIGLVTIRANSKKASFKKGIYTIPIHSTFIRIGSNTTPVESGFENNFQNHETVIGIENNSRNSIEYTLDNVIDFLNFRHKDINSKYKVFKELFVICWAGIEKKSKNTTYLSRVDIELINEQIKLFYSAQDVVEITFDEDSFTIIEYVPLDLNDRIDYYPLEEQTIHFQDNGYYNISRKILFQPPSFNKKILHHVYNNNISLLQKLENQRTLTKSEQKDLENLPSTFMVCYLNGFENAKQKLIDAKQLLKPFPQIYSSFKESLRILRKLKYDVQ